jgi:hypothetical protein
MSDTQSLKTSLLQVMIPSKNERVFIRDLSDHTLQIIFDVGWASMKPDLAIRKRQGSRGITIVSLQRKIIFDIQFNPYRPK